MKKMTFLLLVIVSLLCCNTVLAENEISFQGIPWLANDEAAFQTLSDAGMLHVTTGSPVRTEENVYIVTEDEINYRPDIVLGYENVCFSYNLDQCIKGKIAGYPVKDLILTFAYDGEYKLISVRVELIKGEYTDLKDKLTKVYGEGLYSKTEEGIETNLWKGDNNSAVLLYTQSEGYDYTLIYGRLDAVDILAGCVQPDSSDVSGL